MSGSLARLVSLGGAPIVDHLEPTHELAHYHSLGSELTELLYRKNGFYCFESSLLIRPLRSAGKPLGIIEWNDPSLWRSTYDTDLGDALFFAEDLFGGQFCVLEQKVWAFDPETGEMESVGSTLEEWAVVILDDIDVRTGFPLAQAWVKEHGPLSPSERLLPRVPFVCGGEFRTENLYAHSDLDGMRARASIANQIRNLPENSQIIFRSDSSSR